MQPNATPGAVALKMACSSDLKEYGRSYLKQLLAELETLNCDEATAANESKNGASSENSRKKAALELANPISKITNITWDDVHQLEVALLEIEPVLDLERRRWSLRAEYQEILGDALYKRYLNSIPAGDFRGEEASLWRFRRAV
jgi:hypothetical protein